MDYQEPDGPLEQDVPEPEEAITSPEQPVLTPSRMDEPEADEPLEQGVPEPEQVMTSPEQPVLTPSRTDEPEADEPLEQDMPEPEEVMTSPEPPVLTPSRMDEPEADEPLEQDVLEPSEESAPPEPPVLPPSRTVRNKGVPAPEEVEESVPEGPAWFVIHCYSGYENKVRHNLEQRIETMGMKDRVFDVVVPTQEEIEVRDGKRRTVERHIFPGYVLVNMLLSEESWFVVRNTPGVTGFVGMGNLPTPLRPEEVSQILKRMEADAPTIKVTYKVGERVRIVDGPFNDFRGVVAEIDMERTKVRVMVSFFGRETPVELDFLQVEKA